MRPLITVIGAHKPQTAPVHVRVCPFREPALRGDVFRIVDADMTIDVNVAPRVDDPAECFVAEVFIQHFLRADHEGLTAAARARIKGKRLDIVVYNEIQRALRGGIAHLNHAVAHLVIPDVEFLCQLFADRLQLVAHVQLQIANIFQLVRHSLSEQ